MAEKPRTETKRSMIRMFDQAVLDSINVTAHSCVRIAGEKIIYIDPIRIEGEPHDADIILFTHAHLITFLRRM